MTPARDRALAVGLCVLGAAVVLLACSQRWVSGYVAEPGFPRVALTASGRGAAPAVAALGVVALAGSGAMLLVRRAGRTVIGAVLVLLGVAALAQLVAVVRVPRRAVQGTIDTAVARGSDASLHVTWSGWVLVGLVGVLLVVAGGALCVVRGGRWPERTRRYDAAPDPAAPEGGPGAAPDADERSDAMWKALDRGEDPTDTDPA